MTAFNLLCESPDLIAPVVLLQSDPDSLDTYSASLVGRTLSARAARVFAPDWQVAGGLSISPKYANGSDRIYEGTTRLKERSYEDTETKGDLGFSHSWEYWALQVGTKGELHRVLWRCFSAFA